MKPIKPKYVTFDLYGTLIKIRHERYDPQGFRRQG